jgi:hypothetical protein
MRSAEKGGEAGESDIRILGNITGRLATEQFSRETEIFPLFSCIL